METSKNYPKLMLMLTISFVLMYLVMFLNINSIEDVFLSLTRLYMALLMVAPMAILMLLIMPKMYRRIQYNAAIYALSIMVIVLSTVFLRNQILVSDEQYMKAMIPHHSSAIMTSSQANLHDPEVKALSEQIIRAQEQEIAQMKAILNRMKKKF